jgi:hypothetical protein
MRGYLAVFVMALSFLAHPAFAQTGACPTATSVAVNPTQVCVTLGTALNAEYDAVDPVTSAPKVTGLSLAYYLEGVDPNTGSPVSTIPLGKPAKTTVGTVWAAPTQLLAVPVGQRYIPYSLASNAVGSSGRSPAGNPFGRSAPATVPSAPAGTRLVAESASSDSLIPLSAATLSGSSYSSKSNRPSPLRDWSLTLKAMTRRP